jgi:hypothetical protein
MEKEVILKKIKELSLKAITYVICLFILCGLMIILVFHKFGPFFPILFLFDFCFWFGHPLFLRYVLKRKWFECTKDYYLKIKYILLPWLIMELLVLLYYHNETWFVLQKIAES